MSGLRGATECLQILDKRHLVHFTTSCAVQHKQLLNWNKKNKTAILCTIEFSLLKRWINPTSLHDAWHRIYTNLKVREFKGILFRCQTVCYGSDVQLRHHFRYFSCFVEYSNWLKVPHGVFTAMKSIHSAITKYAIKAYLNTFSHICFFLNLLINACSELIDIDLFRSTLAPPAVRHLSCKLIQSVGLAAPQQN